MKTTEKIYDQHRENKEDLEKLFFYKDEIAIMQRRLEEVAKKNTSKDVQIEIEHFQDQLIIQDSNIDAIREDVNKNEETLENNILENEVAADHRKAPDHVFERDEVNTFEKSFNELRQELNKFLAKWL